MKRKSIHIKKVLLKTYKDSIRLFIVLVISTATTSCSDFLEVGTPHDRMVAEDVFNDGETATSAVLGIYSQFMGTSLWYSSGGTTVFTGLSSDEFFNTNASNASYNELRNNSLTALNGVLGFNIWDRAYRNIYQANICIEKLRAAEQLPSETRNQLLGESLFCRAFIYFYLVNLFGDVPLILSTDYEANAKHGRDAVSNIYNQIIEDLKDAESLMADTYVTPSRVRPNLKTVQALLARVYLYTGQWDFAITKSEEIINAPLYTIDPLNEVFTIESGETIWQLMPVQTSFNTTEARVLLPLNTTPASLGQMALTNALIVSFETHDLRKQEYIFHKTVNGNLYHFAQKYKNVTIGTVTEYYKVFRLAEQYLIRAEASARVGNTNGAIDDINIIRTRAGLHEISYTDADNIFLLLEEERRRELFAEWGHRWFDLKRTGRAIEVLQAKETNIGVTDLLYPIPNSVLLANPFITQNQGYE